MHNANPLPISTLNPYDTGDPIAHRELPANYRSS
jgi:hypothetical protein